MSISKLFSRTIILLSQSSSSSLTNLSSIHRHKGKLITHNKLAIHFLFADYISLFLNNLISFLTSYFPIQLCLRRHFLILSTILFSVFTQFSLRRIHFASSIFYEVYYNYVKCILIFNKMSCVMLTAVKCSIVIRQMKIFYIQLWDMDWKKLVIETGI